MRSNTWHVPLILILQEAYLPAWNTPLKSNQECIHIVPYSVIVKFFFVVFPMPDTESSIALGYQIPLTPPYLEHSTNLHFLWYWHSNLLFRGFLEISSLLDMGIAFHYYFFILPVWLFCFEFFIYWGHMFFYVDVSIS